MNVPPEMVILGYSEAAMFLRSAEGTRVAALISIHGAQEYGVEAAIPQRLNLTFDDVQAPDESDPIAVYHASQQRHWEMEHGLKRRPPTMEDARSIIQFAERIRNVNGLVLCHCGGGVSRSPAAAILCLATWTNPGDESRIVDHVRHIRPCAMPHTDLIRFADTLLHRNGALLASVM